MHHLGTYRLGETFFDSLSSQVNFFAMLLLLAKWLLVVLVPLWLTDFLLSG